MWVVWLMGSNGSAHVGDVVGGIDIVVHEGVVEIEASYGLVIPDGDTWRWVCHEAVTAAGVIRSPRYSRSTAGVRLAWMPDPTQGRDGETLFRSTDGCDWPAVSGLGVVTSAAFDPLDPQQALVASGTVGAANTLWTSSDAGATFAPVVSPLVDRRFSSVAYGAGEAWASGSDEAGLRQFLWHRGDGGWVEHELPAAATPTDLRILAPGEPGVVWLLADPFGADTVVEARSDGTSSVALARDVGISDGAWDGERLWLVQDGVFLIALRDGEVEQHPEFPLALGITVADGAIWTAPQSYLVDALVSRATDGGSPFEILAWPDDITATLDCPAGTAVAEVCEPLWVELLPRLRGYDDVPIDTGTAPDPEIPPHTDAPDDAPPAEGPSGCGCGGSGGGTAALLLVGLVGRRRHGQRGVD